ncbi:MAG: hypothetical protein WB586_08025 [Chthoniobacterales bacterium]
MHCLDAEVQALDVDLFLLAIAGDNEKTKPVDVALEIPIGVVANFHEPI